MKIIAKLKDSVWRKTMLEELKIIYNELMKMIKIIIEKLNDSEWRKMMLEKYQQYFWSKYLLKEDDYLILVFLMFNNINWLIFSHSIVVFLLNVIATICIYIFLTDKH